MSDSLAKIIDEFVEGKILDENLDEIVGERFGRYSKYIIQDRALPDVRDGLKPVQRRILFAMHKLGLTQEKPYKKSARIVGDVIGKYHPHGDSSVYESIVRMSQDFKMRMPLIDMHGNNGSIDGDSAAAMRYTEARMSKVSEYLLKDIDKKTVDFIPNFDDEEYEPIVLPARFPNLLINGASGISAGYATEIPPHNLNEVIRAVIKRIDQPDVTLEALLKIIKGPDFPTGAIVQGKEGIKDAYETGRGRIIIKSKVKIQKQALIITEIPYEVNKASLVRSIDDIRLKRKIDGLKEVRDESNKEGLRIVVDIKPSFAPEAILNFLHKKTDLTKSFNYNMVAINQKRPQTMGLLDILDAYIYHQKEVTTNRANFDLKKAQKRLHIVEGIIRMIDILDAVIALIRKSKSKKDAKNQLIKKHAFSEEQAEAILILQLYKLSSTDLNELKDERTNLEALIKELNDILSNEDALESVIKDELKAVQTKIKTKRQTQIEEAIERITISEEDLIESENVAIGITKEGYIRQSSLRSYKATEAPDLKDNDGFLYRGIHSTHDTLLLFTDHGHYVYLPIFKIPQSKWKDIGTHLNHFVATLDEENIIYATVVSKFDQNSGYLLFSTRKNMVKLTAIEDFDVLRYNKTFKAITLNKNDRLTHVSHVQDLNGEVVSFSKRGEALKYRLKEIAISGTQAKGVKSMSLSSKDHLSASIALKDHHDIVFITSRGTIKRLNPTLIPLKKRTLKGVALFKQPKSNPYEITDVVLLNQAQYKYRAKLHILTNKGSQTLSAFELKQKEAPQGKRFIKNQKPWAMSIETVTSDEELSPINEYVMAKTTEATSKQFSLFED